MISSAIRYLALFALVFGIFTAVSLVPSVTSFCNYIYQQPTAPILKGLLPDVNLNLVAYDADPGMLHIEFISQAQIEQQTQAGGGAPIIGKENKMDFYNMFLSFFLFYCTLILLSPITWKEKTVGILLGGVLYYLYTVFKIYLRLFSIFNQAEIGIYHTAPESLKIYESILAAMTVSVNVLIVLLLWAFFALRKNNWMKVL